MLTLFEKICCILSFISMSVCAVICRLQVVVATTVTRCLLITLATLNPVSVYDLCDGL